jgi:hypothetical protein
MIEVGLSVTWDPPVMQQLDRMAGEMLLEADRGATLAAGSLPPAPGALRLLDHTRQDRADQPSA